MRLMHYNEQTTKLIHEKLIIVLTLLPHTNCSYIEKIEVLLVQNEYGQDSH